MYLRTPLCFDGKWKISLMWKFQYTFHLGIVQGICSQNQSIYLIPENLYYSMWSPYQRPDFWFSKFNVHEYHPGKLVENADWSMPSSPEVSAKVVGKSQLRNIRIDIPSFQMLAIWNWIDYHTWYEVLIMPEKAHFCCSLSFRWCTVMERFTSGTLSE